MLKPIFVLSLYVLFFLGLTAGTSVEDTSNIDVASMGMNISSSENKSLNESAGHWQFIGIGGCSVLGKEGRYGPHLVHSRTMLDECVNYGDKAGVNAVTVYGDGFC